MSTTDPLRRALQRSLHAADPRDSEALQARVLAQWRQRHGHRLAPHEAAAGAGGVARRAPRAWAFGALAVLLVASAIGVGWSLRPSPAIEDLMQPDVLSQISLGEL